MQSALTGQSISPWHDIPLNAENGQLNFVCEIPKESSAKMEVATVRPLLPGLSAPRWSSILHCARCHWHVAGISCPRGGLLRNRFGTHFICSLQQQESG